MDIRQVENEILAIDAQAKYHPIIDVIMTLTDGVDVMSMDARLRWIDSHSLKIGDRLFFVDIFIDGTQDMGEGVLGLQKDSLGRMLSKKYSSNDIIYACTYFQFVNQKSETNRGIFTYGSPPILKEERKIDSYNFERTTKKDYSIVSDILYEEYNFKNCRVQFISSSKLDDENQLNVSSILGVDKIKKIIQGSPAFSVNLNNREFEKIRTNFVTSIESETSANALLSSLPDTSGGHIYTFNFNESIICNPILLQVENEGIELPDIFTKYVSAVERTQQNYRFFKIDDGYIIDISDIEIISTKHTLPDGEEIDIEVKVVKSLNVMIFDGFNTYPNCYVKYDPKNPNEQPQTLEEVQAAQAEALKLPIAILTRQMKVAYNGKKRAISYVSLDKWSKSNLSYGQAVEIMNEHISYYSTIVKKGGEDVRINNGNVYEQTRIAGKKQLTDSEGNFNSAVFREKMSRYAFTVEETFFNLNDEFGNPEKLFGYFLGMGISANNLHLNQVNPYRILCARLLGIDYALNYYELCTESVIAGHLFVDSFDEGIPTFCNADVLLDSNYYVAKEKIESQVFQEELVEYFGEKVAPQVSENHEKLLKDFAPKFMKLHHGTKQDYQSKVRSNGFANPYEGEDRMREVTRITLALGLIETSENKWSAGSTMNSLIMTEYQKSLEPKYAEGLGSKIHERYNKGNNDPSPSDVAAYTGMTAFQNYSNKMDGLSLYGKGSNKLRNNDLDKEDAIRRFYFNPKSSRAGAHDVLRLGVTITNKELKDDGSPRKTEAISINWTNYKKNKNQSEPPVLDAKFVEQAIIENPSATRQKLIDLGYDLDNDKERKELARIISIKAKGEYYEISSLARIEGDELYSLAYALASEEGFDTSMEDLFNLKYNNFAYKPFDRIPIFLENNRTFGDTERFIADSFKEDGSAAGFSLRKAQQDGMRFLGASGNSGLLAHEVGFGKTTSSIAKVSDMFLRGDAKRVLISVPNPVYESGNWSEEISGTKDSKGRQRSNGLLPSNITLVELGSMKFEDLKGNKISEGDPEYDEKSEGTGFDGAMKYSESDLELRKVLSTAKDALTQIVGGTMNKYGKNSTTSMLTPFEQKHGLGDFEDMWLQQNPFFKKSEEYKKENIVRINDTPRQSISGLVTTIKSGDFDFWDIGDSNYMEFGRISDISDDKIDETESFLKKVYKELKSKSPLIEWDDKGGDLERIISKLKYIHRKYDNKYKELSNKEHEIEKKGRGKASIYGGALSITGAGYNAAKRKNANIDEKYDVLRYGEMTVPASYWIAVKTLESLREDLPITAAAWFPYIGTRSFWQRVVLPWAKKNHKNSPYTNIYQLQTELEAEFPFTKFTVNGGKDVAVAAVDPALEALAKAQIKTALELQMTEEIAYFFITLSKQAPLFLGKFKDWAMRPNSVLLCSHLAIPKLSVSEEFGEQSVDFMAGIYGNSSPTQFLNARAKVKGVTQRVIISKGNKEQLFKQGVRTRGQTEKLFLSQYRGLDINQLSCDAFIVDEVHNFNRAFNNVKKGSKVTERLDSIHHATPIHGGKVQANVKGSLRYPENVYSYDTKANYNIRAEVQNFISVCLYFQERGRVISEGQKRKIENTIFLSATPFTDDNFQMLSLFGAMSASKLMQANVFNTFDFFQLYTKELWQKDIDYQNRYTLFPKIVGYKNIYSLSQLIKSFTNFKISDVEIEKERPQKVIIGTKSPKNIKGIDDDSLNKVLSQVPFNEAQKKMNADLNDYITLETDSELSYTQAEYEKAEEIFEKLQKKGKKENPADPFIKKLIKRIDGEEPLVKITKSKTSVKISYELDNLLEIENLLNEIQEIDPDNVIAKQVRRGIDDIDIEGAEGEDEASGSSESVDDDDIGVIDANALKSQGKNISLAQKIAQRALEASRTQQLTLISPYYLTINNDKSLMNPYLPSLDGTPSENAKNVIENSPKLLYSCKAIRKVLEFAYNEKGQRYAGESETEAIMGQVVYANNYKFRYHGKDFFIFDLMIQYLIDENKELLETIVGKSGRDIKDVFASIDGRTRDKTTIVDEFNNGYCLVLFGTEIIKEGINLQKNCPIMYILQVGFVPVTYMQLHGRVWRQKNPYQYAFLINVLTQNSIDAFVYSKLENKIASVKQMLGSEVYDCEETQFDVDVAEIKINLITDPEKLAEMEWEDVESVASRDTDRLKEELKSLESLEFKYPEARAIYAVNFTYMNTFSDNIYKYESYILGKFYAEKMNTRKKEIATDKLVDAQYPAQFASDKLKEKFEESPEKFKGKDGKSKYESKRDMESRLSKTVKIKEMTLKEGIEMVQELNNSGDEDSEFRLSINQTFDITSTTSLTAFVTLTQSVYNIAERTKRRTETLERNESRVKMLTEYFDPAAKVYEKIKEGADPKDVLEALALNSNRSNFRLKGKEILTIACLQHANPDFVNSNRIYDFEIERIAAKFRTGDEAIIITDFNEIVASEQVLDKETGIERSATIDDISRIIVRKTKEQNMNIYTLNNKEEVKEKLRKEYAEKLKERDGETTPSVEDRVNDLEAIFPYLNKAK